MTKKKNTSSMSDKLRDLENLLESMKKVAIAFSGGVDSTFLLAVAHKILKENVLTVIAKSETYPQREFQAAQNFVKKNNIKFEIINTKELSNPNFSTNPKDRCYFCKKELFTKMKKTAQKYDIDYLCDGSNADDINDYRPGLQALQEMGIKSPLMQVGLTKKEIRILSKLIDLPTWEKPAYACLSSRFPYGHEINKENLRMVEKAENFLMEKGFKQVRVRHNQQTARIEVEQNNLSEILNKNTRERIIRKFKQIGYTYITVDLEGYRTGSMNEILKENYPAEKT